MTDLHTTLIAVKALIATPDKWTRGTLARDAFDEPVSVSNKDACQWCLIGAIAKVSRTYYPEPAASDARRVCALLVENHLRPIAYQHTSHRQLENFNDFFGFAAVHKLLDLAIVQTKGSTLI